MILKEKNLKVSNGVNMKTGVKKIISILLIVIGLLVLVTPFTPGSWLIFVGLEMFGIRMLFWDKIKFWKKK